MTWLYRLEPGAEARRFAQRFGDERLVSALRLHRGLDPTAIVDRVFADVIEYQTVATPKDDQTLVVVQRVARDTTEGAA